MRASTFCRPASAFLYALAGAVAACAAVVTFAIGVLTWRIGALTKLLRQSAAPSVLPAAFEVAPSTETAPAEDGSAAPMAIETGAPEIVDEAPAGRGREPDQHQPHRPSAFARDDRHGPRDAGRAAGTAEPDRQLFVGRGELQDLRRRLDRGRNERRNVQFASMSDFKRHLIERGKAKAAPHERVGPDDAESHFRLGVG